jgi:outer membrane protein OmpA-like peptidoglycan-associated protein/tetratricopeptide (TPR) repeat protein
MRIILIILIFSSACFSQHNCDLDIDPQAKKLYKKALSSVNSRAYAKANGLLKQAVELQKDYVDAYYLYANIKVEQKDNAKAREYFEKVISICGNYSPEVYWLVANIAFNDKDFQGAQKYFKNYLTFLSIDEENRLLAQQRLARSKFLIELYGNPVPFSPKVVSGISTKDDEYLSIFSPDNELALFVRRGLRLNKGMQRDETIEEFVFSKVDSFGKFDQGELMPNPFNLQKNQGSASISLKNDQMYLSVCELYDGYNNCDLFYSEIDKGLWTDLKRLKYPINTPDSWESQPSISSDGNTLIFTSARRGGVGKTDLYSIEKNEDGNWGQLKSLSVNTVGSEKSPFLHPDGQTLYFSSDALSGLGGFDIFFCKKDSLGNWSFPKNIGFPINSEKDDIGFFVSTDGKTAYFSSNKISDQGGWDLYSFPLYRGARPNRVLLLKGEVVDENGEPVENAYVEIKSLESNNVEKIEINQNDGKYVGLVTLSDEEDVLVTVKGKDYAFNSQYISSDDRAFESTSNLDFEVSKIEKGKAFKINNIYFSRDSFSLSQPAKYVLNAFSEFLKENTSVKIAIYGHTDSDGDEILNLNLSSKRAKQVQNYIISMGVSSERLSYKGYGEKKPLESNSTERGKSINRRTEFYVVEK